MYFALVVIIFCGFTLCLLCLLWLVRFLEKMCILVLVLYPVLVRMAKVRLFVRVRKQGSRIESVPLKRLVKLSGFRKRRWDFEDGWLVLEAF
jgi:uncharacterized membrane protein